MFNILLDDMPKSINVLGKDISIYTDFRDIIELMDSLIDNEDNEEPFLYMLDLIVKDKDKSYVLGSESCLKAFLEELRKFIEEYKGGDETPAKHVKKGSNKIVLSYTEDAYYILGGFMECYGIDLSEVEYMHWYKFKGLLWALNESTELKQRIKYRSIDLKSIKDKNERKRIAKIQRSLAIKRKPISDDEIASAFL